jgi:short-subunit dehydrogenase
MVQRGPEVMRMAKTKTGKTAMVTGASAGLGEEMAKLFAADGHDLVLTARRRDRLDALATMLEKECDTRVLVLPEDLSDAGAPARLARELQTRGVAVDFLVNNAGYGTNGAFTELDLARELSMIQLNVTTLVDLTRRLLPAMVARKSGRVLNIGSTAGFQPGPFMAVYYATKAFVVSFTEALAYELHGTGVTAACSCPGATHTEFARIAGNDKSRLFQMAAMGAADVAGQSYRAMMRGQTLFIPGVANKLGLQALRLSPRSAVRAVTASLNRSHEGDVS